VNYKKAYHGLLELHADLERERADLLAALERFLDSDETVEDHDILRAAIAAHRGEQPLYGDAAEHAMARALDARAHQGEEG
jgi:hypothetical protein